MVVFEKVAKEDRVLRKTATRASRRLLLLLVIASLFGTLALFASSSASTAGNRRSLTKTLVGKPVATGDYLVWLQRNASNGPLSLHAYDADQDRVFLIPGRPRDASPLTAGGAMVVWVERVSGREERIQGYDLIAGREVTLLPSTGTRQIVAIALDQGVLYYQDAAPGHRGIYAYTIATAKEQQISSTGRNPVAGDGIVLWSEEDARGKYIPSLWSLLMRRLDGTGGNIVLATDSGPLSAYSVSGGQVVWSFFPPAVDRRVFLYRLDLSRSAPISSKPARYPVVNGNTVAWTVEPQEKVGQPLRRAIERSRTDQVDTATIVEEGTGYVATWGFVANGKLAISVDNKAEHGNRELFVYGARDDTTQPPAPSDSEAGARVSEEAPAAFGSCSLPLSCGQVYRSGYYLNDSDGRWPVNGVQFFLPRWGINSRTFYDEIYWGETTKIDYWLDKARDYLYARTLRIFVELPSNGSTPTTYETLYDFALRANARGMRLGVVLQNSTDFRMTQERRDWLVGFIAYFGTRGAKASIAYVSAANEINNWCTDGVDCYDNNPTYVDAANGWVSELTGIFRSQKSGILTTVGISTEAVDRDGQPGWYDFHKADSAGRTLAGMVDFLSPHSYGGGGYGIIHDLRYVLAYEGPIVLEEYGYPTDPRSGNAFFTEGRTICRDDPLNASCTNTAPYFVEINSKAIRETTYAGGAAWMLADVETKRCASDPSDLWTGLFATGYEYCGGTINTAPSADKSTAFRIRSHALAYGGPPRLSLPTSTATSTPSSTDTPLATSTTRTAIRTATRTTMTTSTPTRTATATATATAMPTRTATSAPPATLTEQPTAEEPEPEPEATTEGLRYSVFLPAILGP